MKLLLTLGGPKSILPTFLESFLSWILCICCLGVSAYYYLISNFIQPFLIKAQHYCRIFGGISNNIITTSRRENNNSNMYNNYNNKYHHIPFLQCWIPLTTHSRLELVRLTPIQRYNELVMLFIHHGILDFNDINIEEDHTPNSNQQNKTNNSNHKLMLIKNKLETNQYFIISNSNQLLSFLQNDHVLIQLLKTDTICRRLASLIMRPYSSTTKKQLSSIKPLARNNKKLPVTTTLLLLEYPHCILLQKLATIWYNLLELPCLETTTYHNDPTNSDCPRIKISMIIPAYNESSTVLYQHLQHALNYCRSPSNIEIIIVDAGGINSTSSSSSGSSNGKQNSNDDDTQSSLENDYLLLLKTIPKNNKKLSNNKTHDYLTTTWGNIQFVKFTAGGGRGPCLNYGASLATGDILTFCHLDTKLPPLWDVKIQNTLSPTMLQQSQQNDNHNHDYGGNYDQRRTNACAFAFGIDTSQQALSLFHQGHHHTYVSTIEQNKESSTSKPSSSLSTSISLPPGIKAVETTANLRTTLFSLPYGDQALSIPRDIFLFLGGFPDQCLMEDYELVSLLRRRSVLLHHWYSFQACHHHDEDGNDNNNHDRKNFRSNIVQNYKGEQLKIIPGEPALCSPRRWQKFGVLYVTFMNSKFVNRYVSKGMSPDDLFRSYYGFDSPFRRDGDLSPWELDLYHLIPRV